MTVARRTRGIAADTVDVAIAALRGRGLRITAARRLVVEALFVADGPVSAERIADGVAGRVPRSDLASVYRNLESLEQVGLVRHVHLGHGPGLYALAGPAREYLVCESCDATLAVDESQLDDVRDLILGRFGYDAGFSHFPIVGLCAVCATEPDSSTRHDSKGETA
jgi:Fur family ferric uptake transcriptional regulator